MAPPPRLLNFGCATAEVKMFVIVEALLFIFIYSIKCFARCGQTFTLYTHTTLTASCGLNSSVQGRVAHLSSSYILIPTSPNSNSSKKLVLELRHTGCTLHHITLFMVVIKLSVISVPALSL